MIEATGHVDHLRLAVAGTLAVFADQELRFSDGITLAECIWKAAIRAGVSGVDPEERDRFRENQLILRTVAEHAPSKSFADGFREADRRRFLWPSLGEAGWMTGANRLILFTLGPDPLAELERHALGRPEVAG